MYLKMLVNLKNIDKIRDFILSAHNVQISGWYQIKIQFNPKIEL